MKTVILATLILLSQELMADDGQKIYLAANLGIDGESIVWPIISLPGEQVMPDPESIYCDSGEMDCTLPMNKTLAALRMNRRIKSWFDADGVEHLAKSGYFNINPLDGAGDRLTGFVINDKHAKKTLEGVVGFGGAMASTPGLIATKSTRNISQADRVEVERIMVIWKKKYFQECGAYCATKKRISVITRIQSLGLKVTEYKLPSGKVLQRITGNSYKTASHNPEPIGGSDLYLIFDVWKYAGAQAYIDDNTRVESTGCESQCGGGWDDSPEVIEYKNSVYMLGGQSGGEVYGYFLYKVKGNTLKLLASLTGGS